MLFVLACTLLGFSDRAVAQDHSLFTQFYLNPYVLNPSCAGMDGQPSLSLIYQRQWMTIPGAPSVTNLTFQAPLRGRLSGAVNVANESVGFFNYSGASFSAAYFVPVSDDLILRFGISAGGSWSTVDMQKLDGLNDPALSGTLEKSGALTGNAGLSLQYKGLVFGAALPALFPQPYADDEAFTAGSPKPFEAVVLHAGKRFYFNNDKNIFEPYLVYRINAGLPSQLECAGIVHLNHVLWAGGSYRQDFGVSALGGITLKSKLALGASYTIQKRGADELNSPSFEVAVTYLFGSRRRDVPVYSFVNTVKPKQHVAVASRRPVARTTPVERDDTQGVAAKETPIVEPPAQNTLVEPVAPSEVASSHETQVEPPGRVEEPESIEAAPAESKEEQAKPQAGQVQMVLSRDPIAFKSVRHEVIKAGSGEDELAPGEYVIVGAFSTSDNAKRFAAGLRQLDFKANYGHASATDLWYVYTFRSDDAGRARAARDRVSKLFLLRDAWLLTVEP